MKRGLRTAIADLPVHHPPSTHPSPGYCAQSRRLYRARLCLLSHYNERKTSALMMMNRDFGMQANIRVRLRGHGARDPLSGDVNDIPCGLRVIRPGRVPAVWYNGERRPGLAGS